MRIQQKNFKLALKHSLIQDLMQKISAGISCMQKKRVDLCSLEPNIANSI